MHLKSAKMTIFRLEAIFPLISYTVGRQKTAPNRNQKSFFYQMHTHMLVAFEIFMLNRPSAI